MALADERCRAMKSGELPLPPEEAAGLANETPEWRRSGAQIDREFRFQDFRQAMAFVNRVADLANQEDHHPDIAISYNKVRLTLSTHKVGGLSRNDFILAAKIDRLPAGRG